MLLVKLVYVRKEGVIRCARPTKINKYLLAAGSVCLHLSYPEWSSWRRPCRPHRRPHRSGTLRPHPRTPDTAVWPPSPVWTHTWLGLPPPHTSWTRRSNVWGNVHEIHSLKKWKTGVAWLWHYLLDPPLLAKAVAWPWRPGESKPLLWARFLRGP